MGLRDDLEAILNGPDDDERSGGDEFVDERTQRLREEMSQLLDEIEGALGMLPRLSPGRRDVVYRRVLDELVGLPPESWTVFQDVRRRAYLARRERLVADPGQVPEKVARVEQLSNLLYGTPFWEIEAGLRRLQQGLDLGVSGGQPAF